MIGRLALGGLRAVVLVHAAMVLAQAAFAGRFLAGDAAGLRAHETNAGLIELVALLQLAAGPAGPRRFGWRSLPTRGGTRTRLRDRRPRVELRRGDGPPGG
jgi:hypothetical protein